MEPDLAVGYTMTLGGVGCLADKPVEIGSTVAIADSIASEPVCAPKAEWQDYTAADTENVDGTPFALETAVGTPLATFVPD